MGPFAMIVVSLVAVERLGEVWLSHRNAAALLKRGAVEHGRRHSRVLVFVHTLFLPAIVAEILILDRRPFSFWWILLIVFVLAQALRVWAIATLGRRWCIRVLVLPGEPLVNTGPYRWMRHPMYAAVTVEVAVLPLLLGAWGSAAVFLVLLCTIAVMVRMPCEERALAEAGGADPPERSGP